MYKIAVIGDYDSIYGFATLGLSMGKRQMNEYSEECLNTFLKEQKKLFDEPVAENMEEAEAFLADCMAVVVDSIDEVREYFEEEGVDVDGMSAEDLEEASEVFALPDGTYLIVEG